MIQFNLLPDIKLQYMKAQRQKNLVLSVSIIASIAAVAVFVVLILVVDVWQKKSISDVNTDIATSSQSLTNTPNLNKILTVQNQLSALTSLHDQSPVVSRLPGYIAQLTPSGASISTLNADFTLTTLTITGSANSANTINTYVDTLKFATYQTGGASTAKNAFTKVVLTSSAITSKSATYTITATFAPDIFQATNNDVKLVVPQTVTTRSVLDKPLFSSTNSNGS